MNRATHKKRVAARYAWCGSARATYNNHNWEDAADEDDRAIHPECSNALILYNAAPVDTAGIRQYIGDLSRLCGGKMKLRNFFAAIDSYIERQEQADGT